VIAAAERPEAGVPTRLDTLQPLQSRVGYGRLGTGGSLGYEGKQVTVGGTTFTSALSTHPPARLLYHLGGAATRFRCRVAINDDVAHAASWADFRVVVDGRVVGEAHRVRAGDEPRALEADLTDGFLLELLVSSSNWNYSHAVWLEPELDAVPPEAQRHTIVDPLRRVEIELPPELPEVTRCIATIASPGWEHLLDDLLGSLASNGGCPDARVVVFVIDGGDECERVIAKYRALPVRCRALARTGMASKSALYSVGHVVAARGYVCLDADMLVLDDLAPLFAAIDACPEGSVLACREGNGHHYRDVEDVLQRVYSGRPDDIPRILGHDDADARRYPLSVNDGTFAGSRTALLALDAAIRGMPGAIAWLAHPRVHWRNQFIFNLALARLRCGVELDERYNIQLNGSDVEVADGAGAPRALWQGRGVRILHANGWGRNKYPQLRGLYSSVSDPLVGRGDGDLYADFLKALRAWVGRYGVPALGYSFHGVLEEDDARVRDPSTFPALALLHYLARASGWARVVETGTARGVSAACLASAVSHRPGARVVSFDPVDYPEREPLWTSLPAAMRACIEQRPVDSLAGMREALERGERYDAALLDSVHTEDHVGAELELALELVEAGGLVLVHDWRAISAVDAALARAEADGRHVIRLLGGGSVAEDDRLGLAAVAVP
jgi:predicted O-methyltransferase YrrM